MEEATALDTTALETTNLWDLLCFDLQELILKKKEELEILEWANSMVYVYDKVDEWKIERNNYVNQLYIDYEDASEIGDEDDSDYDQYDFISDLIDDYDKNKELTLSPEDWELYRRKIFYHMTSDFKFFVYE